MTKWTRIALPALLAILPVCSFLFAGRTIPTGRQTLPLLHSYGTVEILRDTWGTAHVFSDTDEGAMYGLGFATAEDRAFQMHYSLRIVQGRLSELLGNVRSVNGRESSLGSDIRMRTMGFYRAAKRLASQLDPGSLSLLEAYCAGVNDHIFAHRAELLYLFSRLGLEPEPWTPADCIASWWRLGQFFAGDGLGDLANLHQLELQPQRQAPVVDDAASVIQPSDADPAWVRALNEFVGLAEPRRRREVADAGFRFSHAWVVSGDRVAGGAAALVSDPQTQVRNPSFLYEFHMSGETFNARGVGVAGSPVILIGFNRDVAWGVTALAADQADLFLLKTDPGQPGRYLFDGLWRDMDVFKETVRIRGSEDLELALRETHLGPVATALASDVRSGEEVALKRIPVCDRDVETVQASFAMIRARSAMEFDAAMQNWRFPSANVVFGDRDGNIGYRTAGAFPYRSLLAADGGNAAHDGSSSKHDWIGMVPYGLLPHVFNPGRAYLATANNRPIASFYPIPLFAGTGSGGDTVRSWRLRELLEPSRAMSPEDLLAVHFDSVNAARREIVRWGRALRKIGSQGLPEDVVRALGHLDAWYEQGARSDRSVPGTELAELLPLNFRVSNTELAAVYGGGESGLCLFLKTLQGRAAADPGAALSGAEEKFIEDALALGWKAAQQAYGADPARWQAEASQALRRRKLGYFESLDGFPSLDAGSDLDVPDLNCTDGGTIKSQLSQSYTQWVPLRDADAAQTLLPVGVSEHPESPFRLGCYDAWRRGELHDAPLTRAAVESLVARRTAFTAGASR